MAEKAKVKKENGRERSVRFVGDHTNSFNATVAGLCTSSIACVTCLALGRMYPLSSFLLFHKLGLVEVRTGIGRPRHEWEQGRPPWRSANKLDCSCDGQTYSSAATSPGGEQEGLGRKKKNCE